MKTKLLNKEDIPALKNFLSHHQAQCMFLSSNLEKAGIIYDGKPFQGEYWGCFTAKEEKLKGIAAHYWNDNIIIFAPEPDTLKQLAQTFQIESTRPVAGIIGPNQQVQFLIQWLSLDRLAYSVNRCEDLFELNLINLKPPALPAGFSVVPAAEISLPLLIQWIEDYSVEAFNKVKNKALRKYAEATVNNLTNGDGWVLKQDNTPVSLSAFNARIEKLVQIGPVWTPPEYRNRGYARLLIARILEQERSKGIEKAILFTDTPAAARAYAAIGFHVIGDYRLALLKERVQLT